MQTTKIFIPNAFKPGGVTPTFKPIMNYVEAGKFVMRIFNRWGQQIAEVRDPFSGWDGTSNGKLVSAGTYIYLIEYEDEKSELKNVKGHFTVVY